MGVAALSQLPESKPDEEVDEESDEDWVLAIYLLGKVLTGFADRLLPEHLKDAKDDVKVRS